MVQGRLRHQGQGQTCTQTPISYCENLSRRFVFYGQISIESGPGQMSGRFICCGTYHDHTLVSQRETITIRTTPRLNVNRTNKLLPSPAVFSYTEYSYLRTDEYECLLISLKYRPFSILDFLIYF